MAAKILVMKDGVVVDEISLIKDSMVIGRKTECDIYINDSAVSGVHARVLKADGKHQIKDMSSTNGLHVRGQRVQQHLLKNNDVVLVGEHQLKFVDSNADAKTRSIKKQANKNPPVTAAKTAPDTAVGAARNSDNQPAHLMVRSGADKNQQIDLSEPLTSIGEPGVQVAAISLRPQGHFIVHVDGGKDRNRVPLVNGEPIGFKSRKLEHGDKIEVADVEVEYLISDVTVMKLL